MPNKGKIFNKISFSLPLQGISHNTLPRTSGQAKFNQSDSGITKPGIMNAILFSITPGMRFFLPRLFVSGNPP